MERKRKFIVCIFVILLLGSLVLVPVSAVTVEFVDKAYMKNNDYQVTDNTGAAVTSFNGSATVTLTPGKSYSVLFSPTGLFDFSKEQGGSFTSLGTTLGFFGDNLAGLIVLSGLIAFAVMYRGHG
jgi:hypothetical protein